MEMIPFLGLTTPISSTGKCPKTDYFLYDSLTNHRIVVLGLFALNLFIRAQPVFERDFSPNDPLIQHPYTPQQ